jgi:sulfatase maturation enzyme AslB (radical SAM superfamily)
MIIPAHDEMLDRLISAGFAKNIWLEYDSNCSAINHKIIERWSHFKQVQIRASMDAIGDQYDLIRFGGQWDKFVENINKLKEYEVKSNRQIILQRITTCFQISTIYSIIESEKWCKEIGVPFLVRFLEDPIRHRVAILPSEFKLELIEYFTKHIDQSEKAKLIVPYLKNHMDSKLENIEAIKDYIKFMDYLDTTRNTNWKQTLPEVSELLNRVVNK